MQNPQKLKTSCFESGVVAARPGQMYGWGGITRIKGREILVSTNERKFHVCPFGREVVVRSLDGGRTWQLPQEVYNSELDDRDSNLLTMPDGTIVMTWFTSTAFEQPGYFRPEWKARVERLTQKIRDEVAGKWLLRSYDGGHTWETTPHRVPIGEHAGPTVLADKSLIYIDHYPCHDGREMTVFVSRDVGETWEKTAIVSCPRLKQKDGLLFPILNENHVLEVEPGKLLALFRSTAGGSGALYQSDSEDNGRTWTEARELPIWGFPPHLIKLSCGAIMCAYSHRREPWSIRVVLSYDKGKTWDTDNIITLCEWKDKPDMGYPVSVEVEPGEILTVYYCSREDSIHIRHEEKIKGSTPEGLLYTRFRLG